MRVARIWVPFCSDGFGLEAFHLIGYKLFFSILPVALHELSQMFLFCTDFVPVVNMVNRSNMQRYRHGSFVLLDYSVPSAVL
jgi:hypothetical protein